MKILLTDISPDNKRQPRFESMGLAYLKGNVDRRHDTHLCFNCIHDFSIKELITVTAFINPDVLGLSLIEENAEHGISLVKALRREGYRGHITLGHHFSTFSHRELLEDFPEIDSVVRGEGEETFNELINRLESNESFEGVKGLSFRKNGEIIVNPSRPLIEELDKLKWPARDYTDKVYTDRGAVSVVTSRGCYGNCSFCSIASFYAQNPGNKWRCRSPENVVDEIEYLKKRFGFKQFIFIDDQFIGPGEKGKNHAVGIAENILKRDIDVRFAIACRANNIEKSLFRLFKKAGLETVFIGVESGFDEGLKRFNKGITVEKNFRALEILDELDIEYKIGFIFFDDESTFDEVKMNVKFLNELRTRHKVGEGNLSIEPVVEVYRGTSIYEKLKNNLKGDYIRGFTYKIHDWKASVTKIFLQFLIKKVYNTFDRMNRRRRYRNLAREGILINRFN